MPAPVLRYHSVKKSYGSLEALKGITLDVPAGEIFGIVGPDGAGKTTMIRLAMGIIKPSAGTVTLLDSPKPRGMRASVGYVPQHFSLYANLTVFENIRLYGALYGANPAEVEEHGREMLTKTELWAFRDRYAGNLSGGMKQKLALAVGLIHKPGVLFLDEPTTGVDPLARREFWAMLYEFNAAGVTIVVSTPYMDEAELCRRLVFVSDGRFLKQGTPEEIVRDYDKALLDIDSADARLNDLLATVPGVLSVNLFGTHYHVEVANAGPAAEAIRQTIDAAGIFGESGASGVSIEKIEPSLEDLFVSLASPDSARDAATESKS